MNVSEVRPVSISVQGLKLEGLLRLPANPVGIVLFSHGCGSGRFSSRNNFVAEVLYNAGIASLLFDLLTEQEDEVYENRFNIELLTTRLVTITQWVKQQSTLSNLPIGYFGASTGAASALKAAARLDDIEAVVSRGGRPDLAKDELAKVAAPTLLIVGGNDPQVLSLNEAAYKDLNSIKKLEIVAEATHLFEEPGALEKVAALASNWLLECFQR
jgi:dienelactone hydrolase